MKTNQNNPGIKEQTFEEFIKPAFPEHEYTNCCKECGELNTLWPVWKGRRRFYKCEKCGSIKGGCKPSDYKRR